MVLEVHGGGLPDLLVHGGFCDQAEDHEAVVGAVCGFGEGGFGAAAGLWRRRQRVEKAFR